MESNNWNSIISKLPNPHFLQTYEWGQVKAKYGWEPIYLVWDSEGSMREEGDVNNLSSYNFQPSATALILKRQIIRNGFAARLSVLYSPKGPLLDWTNESLRNRVLNDLQSFAKTQGAIFLKCDPDVVLGTGVPQSEEDVPENSGQVVMSELKRMGWVYSLDQIQFRNTVLIDLNPSEEELLARMKQKTRYNIRLAVKKGVTVHPWGDLPAFHQMMLVTGGRDGFGVHNLDYYRRAYELFQPKGMAELLVAEYEGAPLAALMVFARGKRAWYVYGASNDQERNRMPTYLLQWEAMRWARSKGSKEYDLWGVPDENEETLEVHFAERSDGLWGVYRFKRGFGGELKRAAQAMDKVYSPFFYRLYLWRMAGREEG